MTNDEQVVAIVSFTGAIKREIVRAVKLLKRDESISSFNIKVEASGRIDGDAKIKFAVSASDWGGDSVEGNDLSAAIEELLRRRGWKARNEPLMLTTNEQQRADAERVYTNAPETTSDGETPIADF